MKPERRRKSVILAVDDLRQGLYVTIHSWRDGREWGKGIAHQIEAINLPYLIVRPLNSAKAKPVTLDVRRIRLMLVSDEFAKAQSQGCDIPPTNPTDEIPF